MTAIDMVAEENGDCLPILRHVRLGAMVAAVSRYRGASVSGNASTSAVARRAKRRVISERGRDAIDLHIERPVPSGYEDQTARRRVNQKIARIHPIDRREMSRVVAIHIAFDHLVER
jgi:hypothetical protein